MILFVSCDTGAGGGYNERENVEYISRDESDDEFDDVCSMYCSSVVKGRC